MTEADSSQLDRETQISTAVLSATGLTRIHRQGTQTVAALRGVDLDLGVGEFVAIMGRSGSGKSSLLHILSGLDRPDDGSVLLEGHLISSLPEPELAVVRRQRFGLMLQFYNLLPTLNALENVAFPLMLDSAPNALDRASAFLDRCARALIQRPDLVFADEPTGSLDTATGTEILTLLRATADAGQTILMVTHDHDVASYADRVVTIVDGRVATDTASGQ